MLRKKLLARLGLLVIGFVAGAVVSITLLQNVLADLDAMKADGAALVDGVQDLGRAFSTFENQAAATSPESSEVNGGLEARSAGLLRAMDSLGRQDVMHQPGGAGSPVLDRIRTGLPMFLANTDAAPSAGPMSPQRLAQATAIRSDIAELGTIAQRHIAAEQSAVSRRLRTLIVELTIAALIITNIAIFVLVRTANMILRPVAELIDGSRELAREHFDHRIQIAQHDEFDELAHAYNALADGLAANEQRKVKALQQLAVTLNHELNNVINIIELQLSVLNRRTGDDPAFASQMSSIRGNLERMARTVASLRSVRRIVLTDYLPGESMLDLPRCIEPDEPEIVVPPRASGASTR